MKITDFDATKLVSIVTTDEEEEYVPHPVAKKAVARIPRPVHVRSEKRDKGSMPAVTSKTKIKAKRLNGNNV